MLQIDKLNAWYGTSHILQDVSLEVKKGELVCLIGRNGAGKTTTVKSVAGLIPKVKGSVRFDGEEILGMPAHTRFARGLAWSARRLTEFDRAISLYTCALGRSVRRCVVRSTAASPNRLVNPSDHSKLSRRLQCM